MTQLFKCPGCGGPVSPAANACPRCGQPIAGIAGPQRPAQPVIAPTVPMPAMDQPPAPTPPAPPQPAPSPAAPAPSVPATPTPPPQATPVPPAPAVDAAAVMRPPKKRRRIGLIIGLSVGIPVGVILLILIAGAIFGVMFAREAEQQMYTASQAEQQMTASMEVIVLQGAAETYRLQSPGVCPTYGDLVASGHVTPDINGNDPWGWPYVIDCSTGTASAYSVGPDGTAGTYDDIRN